MTRKIRSGGGLPLPRIFGRRALERVSAAEAFRLQIERERCRSDRNSHSFSLVVFDLAPGSVSRTAVVRLAQVLNERIRITDEVGWVGDKQMGVLLPDTPSEGAKLFCEHVRCAMAKLGTVPVSHVYTYPVSLEHPAQQPGQDGQLWFRDFVDSAKPGAVTPVPIAGRTEQLSPLVACMAYHGSAGAGLTSGSEPHEVVEKLLGTGLPAWKRAVDVVGASIGIVLASPIMLCTATLIKLVSPGPVLFRQQRVGYMGRPFTCFKFRSMHVNNDAGGHARHFAQLIKRGGAMQKLDGQNDSRIIPFGKVIRYTALDELPQLFNVLKGDMSLIGPRPCIPYEYKEYSRWQKSRVTAVPGMTGLWQVNGKNRTTFEQMMRYDIAYGRSKSLWLDMGIILRTMPAIWTQVRDAMNSPAKKNRQASLDRSIVSSA